MFALHISLYEIFFLSTGVQSRQVFARLMNPSLVKQTTQANTALTDKVTEVTLPSHSGE